MAFTNLQADEIFPKRVLRTDQAKTIKRSGFGMWPSGRAPVFGTVDRRFESYHPSQPLPTELAKAR